MDGDHDFLSMDALSIFVCRHGGGSYNTLAMSSSLIFSAVGLPPGTTRGPVVLKTNLPNKQLHGWCRKGVMQDQVI